MRTRLCWCVVAVSMGSVIAAQEHPDFSGEWVLDQPAVHVARLAEEARVPDQLSVRQWTEGLLEFIRIERRFGGEVRAASHQIGLGGGVVSGVDASGRGGGPNGELPQTRYVTRWNDRRLEMEWGSYSGAMRESGPYTEHDERWSLVTADRLVIAVTDRSSTAEPVTIELTYKRR